MILSIALLILSLLTVIKSADYAIHYSGKIARSLNLSKYIVGFLIVAVISILPETLVSVNSALKGVPAFGLGTLYGSNIADLTLVFALVVLLSSRNLKIESKIIKNRFFYIGLVAIPILLGLNGHYSRLEGIILIISGLSFYFYILNKNHCSPKDIKEKINLSDLTLLIISMIGLIFGSHFTVKYGITFANSLKINPVLIGMFVVGVGTTLPELFFSVRAAKNHNDDLALGDILGTVMADATIVVGIIAVIIPFAFNPKIIYITGTFMFLAINLLFHFIKTEKLLTKKEAVLLLFFYFIFVFTELAINDQRFIELFK
ncbi:MAG: hypothetical protein WC414_01550 [Patescibacteria group bacterium]